MATYRSILIVDDDPIVRSLLRSYFASLFVKNIYDAADGSVAAEIVRDHLDALDLVITDLNMPGIDGVQFLRNLHDIGFRGDLVIASGESEAILKTAGSLAAGRDLQVRGCISKPLTKNNLDEIFLTDRPTAAPARIRQTIDAVVLAGIINEAGIVPYFQPKVDVRTRKIVGAEALVRGEDKSLGHLGAHQLIPAAREHGLMRDLTNVMITKVLKQQRAWNDRGIELNLALNIDPAQLREMDLPDRLADFAQDLALKPQSITVEVTEESFHSNFLDVMDVVARLRMKGFCTSCDDFGTGTSNMDTLESLPLTELKIDQSFVSKGLTHTFADAAVHAAVRLAKALDLQLVAEGVETTDELDYIAEQGVDIVQGFLFGPPMAAYEFESWYLSNHGYVPDLSIDTEERAAHRRQHFKQKRQPVNY